MAGVQSVCDPRRFAARALAAAAVALGLGLPASAEPLSILYYGNSFLATPFPNGIPGLVSDIAVAAGHEAPYFYNAAVDGVNFDYHAQFNTGVITSELPPGGWDVVVMQNFSTEPTDSLIGNPALHLSAARALYAAVAAVTPDVTPVLFETWARAPGHEYYSGPEPLWTGPAQMQAQLRHYYQEAGDLIDLDAGAPISKIARIGTAWESTGWDNLHNDDLWHASNRGALLASLVLYGTIYNDLTVDDIDLDDIVASLGLTPAEGIFLTNTAEVTLVPEPSSLVLAGCALATLGYRRMRRTRRR
jgi:hypothetical protein